jgi:hypothetical protein
MATSIEYREQRNLVKKKKSGHKTFKVMVKSVRLNQFTPICVRFYNMLPCDAPVSPPKGFKTSLLFKTHAFRIEFHHPLSTQFITPFCHFKF